MRYLALLVLVTTTATARADPIGGRWEGVMERDGAKRPIAFDLAHDDATGRTMGRYSSPTEAVLDYPLDSVAVTGSSVHIVLGGEISFDGTVDGAALSGRFDDGAHQGTFTLRRRPAPALPYRREEVTFRDGAVVLHGTLLLPGASRPLGAVVFLHGSGGEVRWGRSFFYADFLARRGVAALVYDKRGSGTSTGDWRSASYDDLVSDAISAIHYLQGRHEIDRARIGVVGHSEGGTLGPIVAARSRDVAFLVSEAGVVGPIHDQDVLRVRHLLEDNGFAGADEEAALAFYRRWLEVARAGGVGWERVAAMVPTVERKPWYRWVALPPRKSWVWSWYPRVADVDVTSDWEKLRIPVLVVYGERDRLQAVDEDLEAIDRALRRADNRDYTEIILPAAAHNLTLPSRPGEPFEGRIAPGWPELLSTWVSAHAHARAP